MKKLNLFLIFLMFMGSFLAYSSLPAKVPMHWNLQGQVDNYLPKSQAVWILPIMTAIIWILFQSLPYFDPKKDNYRLFKKEWKIMQTAMIGFMTYLHFVVFYIASHPQVRLMPLMFVGLGFLFILLGNYLSKIRQNYFIGIKLPWTLASEDNWNKTHRFASWCFIIAGIITLTEAYFIWYAPVVIFGGLLLSVILPAIYSFLLFKKAADKMKYVYLILLSLALIIFIIRLVSGEDDWICKDGQWIKHGKPTSPMPQKVCDR